MPFRADAKDFEGEDQGGEWGRRAPHVSPRATSRSVERRGDVDQGAQCGLHHPAALRGMRRFANHNGFQGRAHRVRVVGPLRPEENRPVGPKDIG